MSVVIKRAYIVSIFRIWFHVLKLATQLYDCGVTSGRQFVSLVWISGSNCQSFNMCCQKYVSLLGRTNQEAYLVLAVLQAFRYGTNDWHNPGSLKCQNRKYNVVSILLCNPKLCSAFGTKLLDVIVANNQIVWHFIYNFIEQCRTTHGWKKGNKKRWMCSSFEFQEI